MKARVKATGEIVDATYWNTSANGIKYYDIDNSGNTMMEDELDFDFSYTPDYWTKLEHQYAGMAMQGLLMNEHIYFGQDMSNALDAFISTNAAIIALALVKELKEKEEMK